MREGRGQRLGCFRVPANGRECLREAARGRGCFLQDKCRERLLPGLSPRNIASQEYCVPELHPKMASHEDLPELPRNAQGCLPGRRLRKKAPARGSMQRRTSINPQKPPSHSCPSTGMHSMSSTVYPESVRLPPPMGRSSFTQELEGYY